MAEPKIIKGWLGWAVVGDGLVFYAKTKKEAMRRYQAELGADGLSPQASQAEEVCEDVSQPARDPDT